MFSAFTEAVEKVSGMAQNMAEGGFGKLLADQMEGVVDQVLEWLGPQAAEVSTDTMSKKYPMVAKVPGANDTAKDAACSAVMGLKDEIMDFIGDIADDMEAGFKRIGALLLRAARSAAEDAVKAIVGLLGCCCGPIIKAIGNLGAIIQEIFEQISEALKEFAQTTLKGKGVPDMIMNKLSFDFDEKEELPPPKNPKARSAPEPQVMGAQ